MEIVHVYQKQRKDFGRQPHFELSDLKTIIDLTPVPKLLKKYVERDPCTVGVQSRADNGVHFSNTDRTETDDKGMSHLEGGWPKDVNVEDPESKKRHIRKLEGDDKYVHSVRRLAPAMESSLKQNIVLDIYEAYFEDDESYDEYTEQPEATIITVLKDPKTKKGVLERTVSHLSWLPTGGTKIAAAFCSLDFEKQENVPVESYVWSIQNTNTPEHTLIPPRSPLVTCEFNPKSSTLIAGGCYDGVVCVFDLRVKAERGPVLTSEIMDSHKEPVFDLKWIQSKNSTQFMSTSTGGFLRVWDTKKMNGPVDQLKKDTTLLEEMELSKADSKLYNGVLGGVSIHYDLNFSATKFMIGTEQGIVITGTRRKNKPIFIDKMYFAHVGPVYCVDRNRFIDKYFLSVGDWTVKIWNEDVTSEPIIATKFNNTYLTDGCWLPSRPSVFLTTKLDGHLDIWNLVQSQKNPVYTLQVSSSSGLQCVRPHTAGLVATGSMDGIASIIRLNDSLSGYRNGEWQNMRKERERLKMLFDRETARETILIQNRKVRTVEEKESKDGKHEVKRMGSIKVVLGNFDDDFESIVPLEDSDEDKEEPAGEEGGREETAGEGEEGGDEFDEDFVEEDADEDTGAAED